MTEVTQSSDSEVTDTSEEPGETCSTRTSDLPKEANISDDSGSDEEASETPQKQRRKREDYCRDLEMDDLPELAGMPDMRIHVRCFASNGIDVTPGGW